MLSVQTVGGLFCLLRKEKEPHFSFSSYHLHLPKTEFHNSVFTPTGNYKGRRAEAQPFLFTLSRQRTLLREEEGYAFWHGGPGF